MKAKETSAQRWQRIFLLIILGYEAAGCLVGGVLLVAAPDGRYMDMPVRIMNGVFRDFSIPGAILFALGILNTFAFISVLRKFPYDWLLAGLALGGLFIWFVVEIIILNELHWLHAMWGLPVMLGCVFAIPFIAARLTRGTSPDALLACGALSSLWYVAINLITPLFYDGYSLLSQAPSELSAIGAPTRILWDLTVTFYPLLFAAFGWGVLQVSAGNRYLRIVGNLIIVYAVLNFYWPPMHRREVIANGGGTWTDTLHLVWASVTVFFMILFMVFGAKASGKKFRLYTAANLILFLLFGTLTFIESSSLEAGLPTPWMGLWERINIAAFMVWVGVFSFSLVRKKNTKTLVVRQQREWQLTG
jgi:hypothetical protein